MQENRLKMATNIAFVREDVWLPVKPLEMAYPNNKLSFWYKTLIQMKNTKFCRKEKREAYLDQFLCQYFQCKGRCTAPS